MQTKGERDVDLSVDAENVGAPDAALVLVVPKANNNFLKQIMSEMKPRELAATYSDDISNDAGQGEGTDTTINTTKDVRATVDGSNELNDDLVGAIVVVAAVELGRDGVNIVSEGGEGVLDGSNVPLHGGLGNSPSEGHNTGSDDSEDSEETHGAGVRRGYLG